MNTPVGGAANGLPMGLSKPGDGSAMPAGWACVEVGDFGSGNPGFAA